MHLLEGNEDKMTISMKQTRMVVFVYVKCTFSLVQATYAPAQGVQEKKIHSPLILNREGASEQ
jgi:hypothetical protein